MGERTEGNSVDSENHKDSHDCTDSSNAVLREMAVHKIQERMKSFQQVVVKEIEQKLDVVVEELLNEIKRFGVESTEFKQLFREQNGDIPVKIKNDISRRTLPEKKFVPCNSLLTDLFEVKHMRTIYHIFVVILFILFLNTVVHDFVGDGTLNIGLYPIKIGFGKFHIAMGIWSCMQMSAFALYYVFMIWAVVRTKLKKDNIEHKYWDIFCLNGFIIYQFAFVILVVRQVFYYDLPGACSIMILMETVRFLMKSHAFVRSNTPRVLAGKLKTENDKAVVLLPSFKTYTYFLFAPTLVYRDNYPRTKYIRWNRVIWNYVEVIGSILCVSFIFERFLIPYYHNFGDSRIEAKSLVLSIFGCILPGTFAYLCGFYCLLHAWMNASAEMLRFADRMFYKDWWNASSFDVYFRTWNIVVHDWLYTYIYKDMYEHVFKGSKVAAALVVFSVSAIVHEFILALSFRFFYPVLYVFFQGFGMLFMFVKNRKYELGNIFLWFAIALGNGLLVSLYSMEFFARRNCAVNEDSIWEYFIPVSWRCNGILTNSEWKIQSVWSN